MFTPHITKHRLRAYSLLLAMLLVACCVAAPLALAAGLGEGNAAQELTKPEGTETTTTSTATTATTGSTETSNSKSTSVVIIALAAAGVLLGGITFVIIRDVRRVAPATDAEMAERSSAGGRDPTVALRKRRAKAKAARQQRKRNR